MKAEFIIRILKAIILRMKIFFCHVNSKLLKLHYHSGIKDQSELKIQIDKMDFLQDFQYMDESSPIIKKMFNIAVEGKDQSNKYNVIDKNITVYSQQDNGENWLVFFCMELPEKYIFEFDYMQETIFHEFQISFNYRSLYERNRFMIIENSEILFDCITRGKFFTPIFKKKKEIVFKDKDYYHIKLINCGNSYEFWIDEQCIFSIIEKNKICRGNGVAIIFWENDNNRKIAARILNPVIRLFS